jgi:hypothetical protein
MSEYYEKYLKYKNKYLNLQSQIGGVDEPVFIAIPNLGKTTVVSARPYQAYAYNKYFAIKNQSSIRNEPISDKTYRKDWNIMYTIFSDKVHFEIIDEQGYGYEFDIIDFNFGEIGMGDESFCILVNDKNMRLVLSNREQSLKNYVAALQAPPPPLPPPQPVQLVQKQTWFSDIFGFSERTDWAENVKMFQMVGDKLQCNTAPQFKSLHVGLFECLSVAELRGKEPVLPPGVDRLSFKHFAAPNGIGPMHLEESNNGAVFQAASQFNCLEMTSQYVSPTAGVTIYENDRTQGPACALACPAALVYRNYLVKHMVDGVNYTGQHPKQIDNLKDVGVVVNNSTNNYWYMQNGYALPVQINSLSNLASRLRTEPTLVKKAEDALRVGVHWNTSVWNTSVKAPSKNLVCQVYASALPCAYAGAPMNDWEPFARLVLRGSYNATLSVAAALTEGGTKRIKCYLTFLGGGVFGNKYEWIIDAIRDALDMYRFYPIDVVLVHYGSKVASSWITDLAERETMEERLEREQAENALREGKVFIAYPTSTGSFERPIYDVAEARPHQKEAYKIFMKFIKGEITKSVTETVDDMKITAAISIATGKKITFHIKKTSEQEPYFFRIEEFSDRFRDEVKYSLFCNLIDKFERVSYLSNNEPLLRRWVNNKMKGEAH